MTSCCLCLLIPWPVSLLSGKKSDINSTDYWDTCISLSRIFGTVAIVGGGNWGCDDSGLKRPLFRQSNKCSFYVIRKKCHKYSWCFFQKRLTYIEKENCRQNIRIYPPDRWAYHVRVTIAITVVVSAIPSYPINNVFWVIWRIAFTCQCNFLACKMTDDNWISLMG